MSTEEQRTEETGTEDRRLGSIGNGEGSATGTGGQGAPPADVLSAGSDGDKAPVTEGSASPNPENAVSEGLAELSESIPETTKDWDIVEFVAGLADFNAIECGFVRRFVELHPALLRGTPYCIADITDGVMGAAAQSNRKEMHEMLVRHGVIKEEHKPADPTIPVPEPAAPVKEDKTILGQPAKGIVTWMGNAGWSLKKVNRVLRRSGVKLSEMVVANCMKHKKGIPDLTGEEVEKLRILARKPAKK